MPLPIIAGIAVGVLGTEVVRRTVKFFRTTKVERAESALEEALAKGARRAEGNRLATEESKKIVAEAEELLAATEAEEVKVKVPKRVKAKT